MILGELAIEQGAEKWVMLVTNMAVSILTKTKFSWLRGFATSIVANHGTIAPFNQLLHAGDD